MIIIISEKYNTFTNGTSQKLVKNLKLCNIILQGSSIV